MIYSLILAGLFEIEVLGLIFWEVIVIIPIKK
jgi:hypothetical protein